MEDLWIEPTGAYDVEVVVTINNSGSPVVTIDGFGSPAPGVAKRFLSYFSYKSGSYGLEGGPPLPSFSLAGRSSKVVVMDNTQVGTPSSTGASYLSYTQMPVTYSFLGFRHRVGVPHGPLRHEAPLVLLTDRLSASLRRPA
jgi:hypothetical protein